MAGEAIGLIETRGLVGAIEALDACLKAAQVRLSGMDFVTGGLVTIRVTGDVGAVNAAVSAGEAAARRVGTVVSAHVIPRPHAGIRELVYGPGTRGPAPLRPPETEIASSSEQSPGAAAPEYLSPEVPPAGEIPAEDLPAATARVREIVRGTDVEALMEDVGVLSDAPVWKLRKIARYIPNIRLSGIEISNARKEELLLEMTAAALEGGGDSDAH
ncbi:MAG: BMC domain-containing protein [Firmicutes bacterium]|nr:BMC domain-containing protein [Bacillota bacterium]